MKPFALLPAKNRLPKQDTVFLRRNCLSNGCRTCMLLRKRFAVSPRNLSCQKFILFDQEPRIDLFFSAVSGMKMKKIVETYSIGRALKDRNSKSLADNLNMMLKGEKQIKTWKVNLKKAKDKLTWEKERKILLKVFRNL